MIDHEFIDPQLVTYYRSSCYLDPFSAGCRYFYTRYYENIDEINPYNVYSYCFYNDSANGQANSQSQTSILRNIIRNKGKYDSGKNGPTCAFFDGMRDYFKAHKLEYHSSVQWNGPCVGIYLFRLMMCYPNTTSLWLGQSIHTATCWQRLVNIILCCSVETGMTWCLTEIPKKILNALILATAIFSTCR